MSSDQIVFPAYAGMSRETPANAHANAGFPRLRGDEPAALNRTRSWSMFSPPTRG